jgi:uncharacterized RDD family membrane protein YckC
MTDAASPAPPPPTPSLAAEAASFPQVRYAGFWLRFAAWLLDVIALAIIRMALQMTDVPFLGWGGTFLAGWLYFAILESSAMQATPGKMVLGLYVTGEDGRRIGFAQASGRFFGKLLSSLLLGIGYLLAAFTARKQALHDLMAGCLVVRR